LSAVTQPVFYRIYHSIKLDIQSIESLITNLERDIRVLVTKSEPTIAQAPTFDEPMAKVSPKPDKTFNSILAIKEELALQKAFLQHRQIALKEIETEIRRVAKRTNDLELRIFVACWLDGKRIEVVADEFGYAISYIYNKRSVIRSYINNDYRAPAVM
jgi:hypothetical protein